MHKNNNKYIICIIIMHSYFWRLYFCKNTEIKYQV